MRKASQTVVCIYRKQRKNITACCWWTAVPSTAHPWCAKGAVGSSVLCSETNLCEVLQVDHGQPSCCATLPESRAWPTAISASILYLGYLCSVLGYYTWVLHLTLAIPIQFFRFKLCAGRHEIFGLLAREDRVQLYVYDLSNGLARKLSPLLLNKQVGHTDIDRY